MPTQSNTTAPLLSESKPDIKAALRKLQDAAWNCGTDEYRDGVSDAACTRRYDAMIAARSECVSAADALLTENAALREQLAEYERLENAINAVSERVLIPEVLAAMERLKERR